MKYLTSFEDPVNQFSLFRIEHVLSFFLIIIRNSKSAGQRLEGSKLDSCVRIAKLLLKKLKL